MEMIAKKDVEELFETLDKSLTAYKSAEEEINKLKNDLQIAYRTIDDLRLKRGAFGQLAQGAQSILVREKELINSLKEENERLKKGIQTSVDLCASCGEYVEMAIVCTGCGHRKFNDK